MEIYRTPKHTALAPSINVFTGCDSDMSSQQQSDYVFNWVPKATSVYFRSGAYGCLSMTPVGVLRTCSKQKCPTLPQSTLGVVEEMRNATAGCVKESVSDKWQKSLNIINIDINYNKRTFIHLPIHPFIHLSKLSINPPIHIPMLPSIHCSDHPSIYEFICQSINPTSKRNRPMSFLSFL